MSGRARRSNAGRRTGHANQLSALEKMAAIRSGKGSLADLELREEGDVYEVVDEDTYKGIVAARQMDSFVEDDMEELGYQDFGQEIFDEDDAYGGDAPMRRAKKEKKRKSGLEQAMEKSRRKREAAPKRRISRAFLMAQQGVGGGSGHGGSRGTRSGPKVTADDDAEFEAMLNSLGESSAVPMELSGAGMGGNDDGEVDPLLTTGAIPRIGAARFAADPLLHTRMEESSELDFDSVLPPKAKGTGQAEAAMDTVMDMTMDMEAGSGGGGDDFSPEDFEEHSEAAATTHERSPKKRKQTVEQDAATGADVLPVAPERSSNVAVRKSKPKMRRRRPAKQPNEAALGSADTAGSGAAAAGAAGGSLAGSGSDWWSVVTDEAGGNEAAAAQEAQAEKAKAVGSPTTTFGGSMTQTPRREDGSILFYMLDAYEEKYTRPGVVYLVGKVAAEGSEDYRSLCVAVPNVPRRLYVLPRTSDDIDMAEVYQEIHSILKERGVRSFQSRPVTMKYAFEEPGIPAETTYLEVVYPARLPNLDDLATKGGATFSRVFGTSSSPMETFIMDNKLMGPSWLVLDRTAEDVGGRVSWCKYEVAVSGPAALAAPESGTTLPPMPKLKVMSLSLKTMLNPSAHANEILVASVLVHETVNMESATLNPEAAMMHFSAVRPVEGTSIMTPGSGAVQFVDHVARSRAHVEVCSCERALLSFLFSRIHSIDPDVLVGHNIIGFDLDVLLHRAKAHKIGHWSKLGRFRRKVMPKLQAGPGGASNSSAAERSAAAGRLLCDTWMGSKDLVRETNYTLAHLSHKMLGVSRTPIDMALIPSYYVTNESLLDLIRHTENDAYLSIKLMFHLMMIPLTKQLTGLAGNLWSQTLTAGRSLRNEYLLCHEFTNLGYVLPDKFWSAAAGGSKGGSKGSGPSRKKGPRRKKAAYAGGLVLEPKRGFYDTFILLLDFNSLYPSIIQEYNLCFTTVEREKVTAVSAAISEDLIVGAGAGSRPAPEVGMIDDDVGAVSAVVGGAHTGIGAKVPDSTVDEGVLPRLIKTLVERRAQVKKLLKNATDPLLRTQYDIRQKALKLTANSMYGCLGFTFSRFYCKPIASLITSLGREILQNTVDIAETTLNLEVVYGDTDSIMVNTGSTNLEDVKAIGKQVMAEVNKRYRLLELDIDGIFQSLLLLNKKKYSALMIVERNGTLSTVKESKGLDLVRRDWCPLSKDAGNFVLDRILSGAARDEVVDAIHEYLRELGAKVRASEVSLGKFIITKGLTKDPMDYADAKSQPHVQVAIRMRQANKSARRGDFIPYVICKGESRSVAERAYSPDEIMKANGELLIDYEWYLGQQIHPPVSRLCEPIEGTDAGQIADCLGLDSSRFNRVYHADSDAAFLSSAAASDAVRFKDCDRLLVPCRVCKAKHAYTGPLRTSTDGTVVSGLSCPGFTASAATGPGIEDPALARHCPGVFDKAVLANAVTRQIRAKLKAYYAAWYVCDDESCSNRTRQVSLRGHGRQCLVPICTGTMHPEVPSKQMYTQLLYLQTLFDLDHAIDQLDVDDDEEARLRRVLSPEEVDTLTELKARVDGELGKNAYFFVDTKSLFSICA